MGFLQTAAHSDITHSVHMRSFLLGKLRKDPAEELNDEGEVVDGGEDPGACSESVWKLKHLPTTCIFFTGHASAPFVGYQRAKKLNWSSSDQENVDQDSHMPQYLQYIYNIFTIFLQFYIYIFIFWKLETSWNCETSRYKDDSKAMAPWPWPNMLN